MKRRKINAAEQLAQILHPQLAACITTKPMKGLKRIAAALGVQVWTLHQARKDDPIVRRLVVKTGGRFSLPAMNDLDWTYLSTAITLRPAASPAKRRAASKREAAKRKARGRQKHKSQLSPIFAEHKSRI